MIIFPAIRTVNAPAMKWWHSTGPDRPGTPRKNPVPAIASRQAEQVVHPQRGGIRGDIIAVLRLMAKAIVIRTPFLGRSPARATFPSRLFSRGSRDAGPLPFRHDNNPAAFMLPLSSRKLTKAALTRLRCVAAQASPYDRSHARAVERRDSIKKSKKAAGGPSPFLED